MQKKRSILKDLLFVSLSSFIVVAAWIGFNLYHTWVTTTITPEMQVQITAISPDFDTATIQKLKSRKQVTPITTLSNKTPVIAPSGTPNPSSFPLPTSGAAIIPTPIETGSLQPQSALPDIPVTVQGQ